MSDDVGQLEADLRHRIERARDRGVTENGVQEVLELLIDDNGGE